MISVISMPPILLPENRKMTMKAIASAALAGVLVTGLALSAHAVEIGSNEAFDFVAFGDMPYSIPDDYPAFEKVLARINAIKPNLAINVGDLKSGSSPCTDANILKIRDYFETVEVPLLYSIGDNEWTDCHRERAGKFDPLERLARLREWFFATDQSLGKTKVKVVRQADVMPQFKLYVENTRYEHNRIVFVQPHIPGSNNNFEAQNQKTANEYFDRDKANVAWIRAAFDRAKEINAAGVVISFQANLWDIRQTFPEIPPASGFVNSIRAIERSAKDFDKPVLVIHGDEHEFIISPFQNTSFKPVPKITRLQLMGEKTIGAVRVIVDPNDPDVFIGFSPFYIDNPKKN